jgi:hypothetical protein
MRRWFSVLLVMGCPSGSTPVPADSDAPTDSDDSDVTETDAPAADNPTESREIAFLDLDVTVTDGKNQVASGNRGAVLNYANHDAATLANMFVVDEHCIVYDVATFVSDPSPPVAVEVGGVVTGMTIVGGMPAYDNAPTASAWNGQPTGTIRMNPGTAEESSVEVSAPRAEGLSFAFQPGSGGDGPSLSVTVPPDAGVDRIRTIASLGGNRGLLCSHPVPSDGGAVEIAYGPKPSALPGAGPFTSTFLLVGAVSASTITDNVSGDTWTVQTGTYFRQDFVSPAVFWE